MANEERGNHDAQHGDPERLIQMLRECSRQREKLEELVKEILPFAEPPYAAAIFVSLSVIKDSKRLAEFKKSFGFDADYHKCYLMTEDGSILMGTVSRAMGDALLPGQFVIVNGSSAVIEVIPDDEIKNVVSLREAAVSRVMEGGAIMVSDGRGGSFGRVVICSNRLKEEFLKMPLEEGDGVLIFGICIVGRIQKNERRLTTKNDIRKVVLKDLGGLDSEVQEIRDMLGLDFDAASLHAMNRKFSRGIVLHGPPGCGKTTIMAALANELGWFLQVIDGAEIEDKFVGETPRKMRESFELALKNKPSFWFVDEADALFPVRGSSLAAEYKTSYISQYNTLLQGIQNTTGVFVVLATNRIDKIDPAVLRAGRIDRKIFIPRPNQDGARNILRIYLSRHPVGESGDPEEARGKFVDKLLADIYVRRPTTMLFRAYYGGDRKAYYLEDFISGALLENIVNKITLDALKRLKTENVKPGSQKFGITSDDLADVAFDMIVQEIPQDDRSRNEWLIVNGYGAADEFRASEFLEKRLNKLSKPRS
jgi:hypothetical protein